MRRTVRIRLLRALAPVLIVAAVVAVAGVRAVSAVPSAAPPTAAALADAHVSPAAPARNFGRAHTLTASQGATAYLRFRVPAVDRPVASARLRLYLVRGGGQVFFHAVRGARWHERRVTFWRAPAIGRAVRAAEVPPGGRWATFDVSPLVQRPGAVTIAISATKPVVFSSREAGRAARLELATASPGPEAVILAAGDIAACDSQGDEATAQLLDRLPGTILALGDLAYPWGRPEDFRCYDASWGRFKARTRPTAGNHDYQTKDGAPYYAYFGAAAGERTKGYYSFDEGDWHFVALNSNCNRVGGCHRGSAQEQWLRADLAATNKPCTLAYWHHPLFTSGTEGEHPELRPLWEALYDARAELVLVGHDHVYERFAPQTPSRAPNYTRGIRQFTVGTGGNSHEGFRKPKPNSEARNATAYGVLKLVLNARGYGWRFIPEAGKTFTDTGFGDCD